MTVKKMASISRYIGLSTDSKPTSVPVGSTFFEYNTKDRYVTYDGTNWSVMAAGETPAGGTYYWVDSTDGLDTNSGTSSASPFLTVTAAIEACTANAGDIILIMANSPSSPPVSETFPIVVDKGGVTIRGTRGSGMLSDSGIGSDTINLACFEIKAHYVTIENMYIGTDVDGSSGGIIEFNGTNSYFGVTFRNCLFDTQYIAAYGIYAQYDQPYLLVEDCTFGRHDIAGFSTAGIYLGNGTGAMIRRNVFPCITGIAISCGGGCGNVTILDNRFSLPSDTAGKAITLAAGSSGIFVDGNSANFGRNDAMGLLPYVDSTGDDSNNWGLNYRGGTSVFPA